ncbi:unnamed protein product [Closterium sp. NIES-53]
MGGSRSVSGGRVSTGSLHGNGKVSVIRSGSGSGGGVSSYPPSAAAISAAGSDYDRAGGSLYRGYSGGEMSDAAAAVERSMRREAAAAVAAAAVAAATGVRGSTSLRPRPSPRVSGRNSKVAGRTAVEREAERERAGRRRRGEAGRESDDAFGFEESQRRRMHAEGGVMMQGMYGVSGAAGVSRASAVRVAYGCHGGGPVAELARREALEGFPRCQSEPGKECGEQAGRGEHGEEDGGEGMVWDGLEGSKREEDYFAFEDEGVRGKGWGLDVGGRGEGREGYEAEGFGSGGSGTTTISTSSCSTGISNSSSSTSGSSSVPTSHASNNSPAASNGIPSAAYPPPGVSGVSPLPATSPPPGVCPEGSEEALRGAKPAIRGLYVKDVVSKWEGGVGGGGGGRIDESDWETGEVEEAESERERQRRTMFQRGGGWMRQGGEGEGAGSGDCHAGSGVGRLRESRGQLGSGSRGGCKEAEDYESSQKVNGRACGAAAGVEGVDDAAGSHGSACGDACGDAHVSADTISGASASPEPDCPAGGAGEDTNDGNGDGNGDDDGDDDAGVPVSAAAWQWELSLSDRLTQFLDRARAKREGLVRQMDESKQQFQKLATFLGEPPSATPQAIFGALARFAEAFDKSQRAVGLL